MIGISLLSALFFCQTVPASSRDTDHVAVPFPSNEIPLTDQGVDFYLISSHELILLVTPTTVTHQRTIDGLKTRNLHVYNFDIQNGHSKRLTSIEEAITDWPWSSFELSPGKTYLACLPIDRRHPGRIVDLRTGTYNEIDVKPFSTAVWMDDSQLLIAMPPAEPSTQIRKLMVLDRVSGKSHVIDPAVEGDLDVTPDLGKLLAIGFNHKLIFQSSRAIGQPGIGRMLVAFHSFSLVDNFLMQGKASFFEVDGAGMADDSFRLSPRNGRVLWRNAIADSPNQRRGAVFVGERDGTGVHLLAESRLSMVKGPAADPSRGFESAMHLIWGAEWMPDGRTICIVTDQGFRLVVDR